MIYLNQLILDSLCVYGITLLLTQAHIFQWWRKGLSFLIRVDYDFPACRMCIGFWVALLWCLCWDGFDPTMILAVYGLSYFLATQER